MWVCEGGLLRGDGAAVLFESSVEGKLNQVVVGVDRPVVHGSAILGDC